MIADLIAVATRQVEHVNNGQCPDSVQGFDARDPDCPACGAIVAVETATRRVFDEAHAVTNVGQHNEGLPNHERCKSSV